MVDTNTHEILLELLDSENIQFAQTVYATVAIQLVYIRVIETRMLSFRFLFSNRKLKTKPSVYF